jgi:hypothetical protein
VDFACNRLHKNHRWFTSPMTQPWRPRHKSGTVAVNRSFEQTVILVAICSGTLRASDFSA